MAINIATYHFARAGIEANTMTTEHELQAFRQHCLIEAYSTVLTALLRHLEETAPGAGRSLLDLATATSGKKLARLVFDDRPAVESDMYAAEVQEAFDVVLSQLQKVIDDVAASRVAAKG